MSSRVEIAFERSDVAEYELRPLHRRAEFTSDKELELRGLAGIAWEHRGESDFREHIEAIVDWHDRRHVRVLERRRRSRAAALQVLRETNPQPRGGRRAA